MSAIIDGSSLWDMMGLSIDSTTWYSGLGIIIQSMVLASILSKSIEYFDRFDKKKDHRGLLVSIGFGTTISLGLLILTCGQTRTLVYKRTNIPSNSIRFLLLGDMVILLFSGISCSIVGCYYTWRCYVMSKNNRYLLGCLSIGLLIQFIITLVTAAHGFALPQLQGESLTHLPAFMDRGEYLYNVWSSITLVNNAFISITSLFLIFRTKDGIHHYDWRSYHRYISLSYESMLTPTICILIMISSSGLSGSPMTNIRRVFTVVLPLLYYNSFLQTLVGRQYLRNKIESRNTNSMEEMRLTGGQSDLDKKQQLGQGIPMGINFGLASSPGVRMGAGAGAGAGGQFLDMKGGQRVFVSAPRRF
ncbi:uncharacterized protein IL334_005046 [Kwoniella shivajii]|uniref:Uncharacterized protein n=1 Tax=Kwoniella shivajii TaxID=564305 RepID=A0ABZ1D2I3_9TREE|nr:hypothetical protein IL334_005046 [Kwoniella shivajii]